MGDKAKSKLILPDAEVPTPPKEDRTVPDNAKVFGIRITEWSEWLPMFSDEATDNQLKMSQGVTFLQSDRREKLVDIAVTSTGHKIERWIIIDGEDQVVLPEDMEPTDEQKEGAVKGVFGLYAFQAILASEADVTEMPRPMVTSALPKPKPQVHTAGTLPGGMPPGAQPKSKRGRGR